MATASGAPAAALLCGGRPSSRRAHCAATATLTARLALPAAGVGVSGFAHRAAVLRTVRRAVSHR